MSPEARVRTRSEIGERCGAVIVGATISTYRVDIDIVSGGIVD